MSLQERQRQFETAVASFPGLNPEARIARNFGFSNSARIIEGGLFACTNNLHKHFVILSGLSGTGKTQLALKYARAVHGLTNEATDPLLFVCPVRPEWTDPTGLTGYSDVLTNRYVVPTFLAAVLVATAHRDSPVFVVLDEMNLARVEYYLSDVLSCIETGSPLQLHSNDVPQEGTTGTAIRGELPLPANLFIIGTINVDETTNPNPTAQRMDNLTLSIASGFSRFPAGRFASDGPFSGEAFLSSKLLPMFEDARRRGVQLSIELDGTAGYGSSFLEEAFGGLVRATGLPAAEVLAVVQIVTQDDSLIEEIRSYMLDAQKSIRRKGS